MSSGRRLGDETIHAVSQEFNLELLGVDFLLGSLAEKTMDLVKGCDVYGEERRMHHQTHHNWQSLVCRRDWSGITHTHPERRKTLIIDGERGEGTRSRQITPKKKKNQFFTFNSFQRTFFKEEGAEREALWERRSSNTANNWHHKYTAWCTVLARIYNGVFLHWNK